VEASNEICSGLLCSIESYILHVVRPRRVLVLGLLALAAIATVAFAHAESAVGSISSLKGTVQIVRDGKALAATKGMAVKLHDEVITGSDGCVTIVMPDHSSLHLDQSGSLFIGKRPMLNRSTASSKSD
jgi:hypothetical protein